MKKIFTSLIVTLFLFSFLLCEVGAAPTKSISWYTTRSKDHKQALVPPDLSFVESHGGVYIDHLHGDDCPEKVVYLTFDAGYENGNVESVLNTLKDTNTPGAFFVLKHFVSENSALVERMVNEGHLICNHTANHPNLAAASKEKIAAEIKELEAAVEAVTGSGTKPYFRPPEGCFSRELLEHVSALGYKTVFWSIAYADWDNQRQPEPRVALDTLLSRMHNGAVILLHPTSKTNAEILPAFIAALKEQGYRFGTLDELCRAR